jgi:hypothetical protein
VIASAAPNINYDLKKINHFFKFLFLVPNHFSYMSSKLTSHALMAAKSQNLTKINGTSKFSLLKEWQCLQVCFVTL